MHYITSMEKFIGQHGKIIYHQFRKYFNVRSEGLVNSCVSFGQKVGLGLGAAIASWIIAAGGYVETAKVQTASANSAIIFAYVWFGVILAALLLVVSILLNIDKYEGQIKKELEQRHKA